MSPNPAANNPVSGSPVANPVSPGRPVINPVPQTLDSKTPLLMLPVNIETRFIDVSKRQAELWVRIYPDQIAINTHEPGLTPQEISDGQSYWTGVWSAGNPPPSPDGAQAPWRGLASIYGAPRAAWIALQMTPTNQAQQPTAPAQSGVAPNPAPIFPSPPTRSSSWTQAAVASALPDAWTVVLVNGAVTSSHQGSSITPVLAIGFTPLQQPSNLPPGTNPFPAGSPVDTGLQWIVDFDIAVTAGMALKISLTADQRARGFDRIFVYGLRTTGAGGSSDLGDLLDAHHYTDGFALVPQGSPTKNTSDASSAYSRKDPDYDASFAYERQAPLTQQSNCDGNVFANLIGVDPAHLAHTQYADRVNNQSAQDMLRALWPATLGYFLSQMMDAVFQPAQIESGREYVAANTMPRGAVPAFRIGITPYGVLPVTSLKRYKPPRPEQPFETLELGLVNFVSRLWPGWLASSANAPHMQNSGDPDAQLIDLLGMDASSMNFRGRQVLGNDFLWNFMAFLGLPLAVMQAWLAAELSPGRLLLDSLNYNTWDPRVIHAGLSGKSFPISYPTVQSGPLSETDPLKADAAIGGGTKVNYIEWLRQASVADLQNQNYPGTRPTSLLYMILRQSLVLAYVNLAAQGEVAAGRLVPSQFREVELVGFPLQTQPANPPVGNWDLLARPSVPNPALTWGDYLVGLINPPPNSPYGQLVALRASLDRLAALPTAELDRLLTEWLDACSHRLDVWASTIANAILNRTRGDNNGLHLGAFGWVEEIRPSPKRAEVQGTELAAVQSLDALRAQRVPNAPALPVPIQPLVDNGGYIYAPSFEQAAVAAVLRNGYMTHKGTSEEPLLSIDLSSERVRYALYLLQGVQQGQSLNALLGYLFEAGLDDLNLQKYIQPFRDRFPVVGTKLTPSSAPTESIVASNVVDGLALRTAWDTGALAAGQNWGNALPPPGADQTAVIGLLKTIDDYADALGDVGMAEAVFQIMRGNFGRGGGLINAISKGDRPPDPDVVTTPRGGLDLTHRVAILLTGAPMINPTWNSVTVHPRAAAEPWLNGWLTSLLPDPSTVICSVQYSDTAGSHAVNVSLLQLDVGALDCLAMADAAQVAQQAELEARILYAGALPSGATSVQINYQLTTPPTGWVSFPDFFFLAKALRSLTSAARALGPQDMTVPENNVAQTGLDAANLSARASAATTSLKNDIDTLSAAATAEAAAAAAAAGSITPALTAAEAALRTALLACSYYGVTGSVPSTITDANLAAQANSVLSILKARLTQATAPNTTTLNVFSAIFGKGFIVLPQFTPSPPEAADLNNAFSQSTTLVASDPTAPSRWLTQLVHVRPAISRLDAAITLAQALGGAALAPATPVLGQLPYEANDRWLGLPIDPANPPDKGRVALACFTQGSPTQTPCAGLLIDEWPERIPSTAETASLAFHYEEPKARAPQACLLAVCPDDRASWDDDLVTGILQETLELAKIRTVDLSSLQGMGQILPALYFTLNLQAATVSTNFAEERSTGDTNLRA
jgi:hypothetical protein